MAADSEPPCVECGFNQDVDGSAFGEEFCAAHIPKCGRCYVRVRVEVDREYDDCCMRKEIVFCETHRAHCSFPDCTTHWNTRLDRSELRCGFHNRCKTPGCDGESASWYYCETHMAGCDLCDKANPSKTGRWRCPEHVRCVRGDCDEVGGGGLCVEHRAVCSHPGCDTDDGHRPRADNWRCPRHLMPCIEPGCPTGVAVNSGTGWRCAFHGECGRDGCDKSACGAGMVFCAEHLAGR